MNRLQPPLVKLQSISPAILIGAAWLWLFWPMMSGQTVAGFRDSAYLYYPLFEWIDAQWAAGEIPLWNPYCNFGMPVVGDGTSSVFYPGKLIFFCRFLEYPARYGTYLAIHIPIAAAGTYWFARTLRANPAGATLAAIAYAFGGSVIFQVCNVIFLVSAAWLPFALCCVWKMVKTGQYRWAVAAGVNCSLMILGGDPQMVYHVGLIAVATILGETWRGRRRWLQTRNNNTRPYRFALAAGQRLIVMVVVTTALSAIQLLPTYVWSQRSERSQSTSPANVYQVCENIANQRLDLAQARQALIGSPAGTLDHTYQFSQPPWTLLELFWPNFSGKPFPINQRWTSGLPGADRVWVPSIYLGVLTILIALHGFRLWGRRRRVVWISRLMIFFCVASFGWYGAVWLFHEISGTPPSRFVGPQVGGFYWLMQIMLPKYFVFRYPAKLFVIASLAIAILAGINFRRIQLKQFTLIAILFTVVAAIEVFLLYHLTQTAPGAEPILGIPPADALFGQFDSGGSYRARSYSSIHAMVIVWSGFLLCWLLANKKTMTLRSKLFRRTGRSSPSNASQPNHELPTHSGRKLNAVCQLSIVALVLLDVSVANRWLLAEIPVHTLESETRISQQIADMESRRPDKSPLRVFRGRDQYLVIRDWQNSHSKTRLEEVVSVQRETLAPKHHLKDGIVLIGSFASIWPKEYERRLAKLESAVTGPSFDGYILELPLYPPSLDPSYKHNYLTDNRWLPVKTMVEWIDLKDGLQSDSKVTVTEFGSNRIIVNVSAQSGGQVKLDYLPVVGWKAEVTDSKTGKVLQTKWGDAIEDQSITVAIDQPGEFRIEFRYRPRSFWIGASVSGMGWLALLLWVIFRKQKIAW